MIRSTLPHRIRSSGRSARAPADPASTQGGSAAFRAGGRRNALRPRFYLVGGLVALGFPVILWFATAPFFGTQPPAPTGSGAMVAERPRIHGDVTAVNQDGQSVRLSELRGKVWAVTEFFAVCPLCARSNSTDLKALSEKFADDPDFHLVCISIDPEHDDVERLAGYAQALGADARNWWFLTGASAEIHRYLEKDLKFPPAVERSDPEEIAELGRFQHDLGITVVDRDMRIVGKRNLSWAAGQSPALHDQWERHLHAIIETELSRKGPKP
jgi:protein SCO1